MRQVLRLIGNRYGAAATILFVIAVVVVFGKLVGGSRTGADLGTDSGPPVTSISTGTTSTTSPGPDDGLALGPDTSAAPSPSAGAANAETVAVDFTKAWLNHHGINAANWHKGVAKYSTKTLADRLEGVDPGAVQADQMTGSAKVANHESAYVEVTISLVAGTH